MTNKPPPLPSALAYFEKHITQTRYCALTDIVQAYGQQCRDTALEDCAELAEMHDACDPAYIAESIRSLK